MLKSVQHFNHELMATRGASKGGWRNDVQRISFHSAITALVSSSVFEDRLGRATARVLNTR
jgi:hypothetical protein